MSYASFEGAVVGDALLARAVYSSAYAHFRSIGQSGREERLLIVEAWLAFERAVVEDEVAHGGDGSANAQFLSAVQARVPSRVVRKRELTAADGSSLGWEEYYDYVFPDDEVKPGALRLLELAHKWRSGGGASALLGEASDVLGDAARPAREACSASSDGEGSPSQLDHEGGASRKRVRLAPNESVPGVVSAEGSGAAYDQDPRAMDGDAGDVMYQLAIERKLEDAVHDWPLGRDLQNSNAASGTALGGAAPTRDVTECAADSSASAHGGLPRDFYCEEDVGDAADRDVVA